MTNCGWYLWFQSFTLKKYPAQLSLTAWICVAGVIEGSIVTLVMERDMSVWVIGWDSRLLAAAYSVSIDSWNAIYTYSSLFCGYIYIYIYICITQQK